MALETLKGLKEINGEKVIVMDELQVMGYDYTELMGGGEFFPLLPQIYVYDPEQPESFVCPVITAWEKK